MMQVFLTTTGSATVQYWNDPGNWNPYNNTVECVGNGTSGKIQGLSPMLLEDVVVPQVPNFGGPGGGGGGYAKGINLNPTFPVPYIVCPADLASGYYATGFNITMVSGPPQLPGSVIAYSAYTGSGYTSSGDSGGLAGYPTGFAGGPGGDALYQTGLLAAGGGGAAGPHGPGSKGGNATSTSYGAGGSSDGGTVQGGYQPAYPGQSGTQWDATHGTGGGGSGSGNWGPELLDAEISPMAMQNATAGGLYGGGGGGGSPGYNVGPGQPGLIIITWEPLYRINTAIVA